MTKLRIAHILDALALVALCASSALAQVKIAVPSPYTGGAAAYGDNVKAGVELKLAEINASGGIKGQKIEAVYLDEQCEPKESAIIAQKIVADKTIVAIVGHMCSSSHLAALPIYVRAGIPAISPAATAAGISNKNKNKEGKIWSFRDVYRDDFQGHFLAQYAMKILGLKNIAIFYENNDYGIGLKDAFTAEAKKINLSIAGIEGYMKGATDFTPQLTSLKQKNPDGLFISGYYNEGALIATQAKKLGMNLPKFSADGLDNVDYINLAKDASSNTYLTTPFLPETAGPEAKNFMTKFKEIYKRDVDYMSANAYDATGILAKAINEVGADRAKIQTYLAGMDSPEKGYNGITGLTYFDKNGDCQKSAFVKMVKDGVFKPADKQMN
ncbi:branched-chain amino acid transport system substrate-binding protein [Desulfovibrionales bacterium]